MSIVIVGGNERMEREYVDICGKYGCKAKVFTKESGSFKKQIGSPDLLVVFTNTVSHKMVISASQEAKKRRVPIAHLRTGSVSALSELLLEKTSGG